MDSRQLAGALQGLSQNLGTFAGYEAKKEAYQMEQAAADRRAAADKAFQVMLYNAKAQQDQSQFEATKQQRAEEMKATADYRNRTLEAEAKYREDSLAQNARQLDISQQRANTDAKSRGTDRTAGVLSSQLTATGRLIQTYIKQRDAELAKLSSNVNLMGDPVAMDRARDRVEAKYQPIIEKRQAEYDRLNAKFSELVGVEMVDPEVAATLGSDEEPGLPGGADDLGSDEGPGLPGGADDLSDEDIAAGAVLMGDSNYRGAPAPTGAVNSPADIPPGAVERLRANPNQKVRGSDGRELTLLQWFNLKYGEGMGERFLGTGARE